MLDDGVIARMLAFLPKPGAGDPEQRVTPIDSFADFGDRLHEPVAAGDVRELVGKHHVNPLAQPVVDVGWQHDLRPQDAPGDQHRLSIAAHKRDGPSQCEDD